MDRLNFNNHYQSLGDRYSHYGIANAKNIRFEDFLNEETDEREDIKVEEQLIGKFYIKLDSDSKKNKLFYKTAVINRDKDYGNLEFEEDDHIVKWQLGTRSATDYRVKTFLHFGTYGFVTFNQGTSSYKPSVLLTHMMNEVTTDENPSYNLNIGIEPSYPPPPFIPILPPPLEPVDFIVIDDVVVFDGADDVSSILITIPKLQDADVVISYDTITENNVDM